MSEANKVVDDKMRELDGDKSGAGDGEFAALSLNDLMAKLDETVAWFNSGNVNIDEATEKFDYGSRLVVEIKSRLAATENKINQIKLRLEK